MILTSPDRLAEDVCVLPIDAAAMELGDIERQIFAAGHVHATDHTVFRPPPEACGHAGMNGAGGE